MIIRRETDNDTTKFYSEEKNIFWIKEILDGKTVTVIIGGDLISETTYEFSDEIMALASVGIDTIVLDMKEVRYISSKHMSELLKVQIFMESKGRTGIKLVKVPAKVKKEMDKTGISELLLIE